MRGAHLTATRVLTMPGATPPAGGTTSYYLGGLAAAGRLRRGFGYLWLLWSLIHAFPAV